MDDFWNSKVLRPPPVNAFKYKSVALDINNVRSILEGAIETFLIPDELRTESAIMRRLIYKLKLQLRQDVAFKLFESTNRNLNNLFSFHITKDLIYLLDQVPKRYDKDLYLPSKQMLEYVLVRLQAYSQVCSRVAESSFKTFDLMKGKLSIGHQWAMAAVIVSICSRIWQFCRHLITKCCMTYNDLFPLLGKLQITGSKWLPSNYEFPTDLFVWLDYKWLLETPDIIFQSSLELPIFNLLDDDDDIEITDFNKMKQDTTIIIADDTEDSEEDGSCVKFVGGLNNSNAKLSKNKINKLSKSIINIDSDSDVEFVNHKENEITKSSSSENFPGIIDNDDVEVIEPNEFISKAPLNIDETILYNQRAQTAEIYELSDDESDNENNMNSSETGDDIGEAIDRSIVEITKPKKKKKFDDKSVKKESILSDITENSLSEEEIFDDSQEGPSSTDNSQEGPFGTENSQEGPFSTENGQIGPISTENVQNQSVEDVKPDINKINRAVTGTVLKIRGQKLKLNTNYKMLQFLEKENKYREDGESEKCLFSHLPDNDWSCIYYQIIYLIAMSKYEFQYEEQFLHKGRTILREFVNFSDDCLNFENPVALPKNPEEEETVLNQIWKKNFIKTLDTVKMLHIFLEKEANMRQKSLSHCVLGHLSDSAWINLSYKLKSYIVMASYRPLRAISYIKQAKKGLLKFFKVKNSDLDSTSDDSDSNKSKVKSRSKIDKLYESIGKSKNWDAFFEYFHALELYKNPPSFIKYEINTGIMKQEEQIKQEKELDQMDEAARQRDLLFEYVKAQESYHHPYAPSKTKLRKMKSAASRAMTQNQSRLKQTVKIKIKPVVQATSQAATQNQLHPQPQFRNQSNFEDESRRNAMAAADLEYQNYLCYVERMRAQPMSYPDYYHQLYHEERLRRENQLQFEQQSSRRQRRRRQNRFRN